MVQSMKNNEYWSKRLEELEKVQVLNETKYIKMLKEEYEKALTNITKEVNHWLVRFAVNNQISLKDAKKWLNTSELKELKWDVEEYIKYGEENAIDLIWEKELENASAKVHISRLEALQIQIKQELEKLSYREQQNTEEFIVNTYKDTYYKTAYELQTGHNIAFQVAVLDTESVKRVISKPWTTDGQTFSDRIWKNKKSLMNTLQTELTQSIIRGKAPDEMINKIAKQFNVSKNRAGTLVMTESAFFASSARKKCFHDLNVEKYEIVATLDSHTSDICRNLDGEVFDMKDYKEGVTAPPFHVRCRSTTAPYFDDEFEFGARAARNAGGKTYYVPSDMKYGEWYEKYVDYSNKKEYNELDIPKISKDIEPLLENYKLNHKVKKLFNNYLTEENVIIDNENSKPMYYSMDKNKIVINPKHNEFQYYDLQKGLTHEIIHMIDIRDNIKIKDIDGYIRRARLDILSNKDTYKTIFNNERYANNMELSDVFSAITENKIKGYYKHDNEYWLNSLNIEREIKANILTAYLTNNKDFMNTIKDIKSLKNLKDEVIKEYVKRIS